MSHHIVEVKELKYSYPDGTPALNGVNFRITHGESVALVGANGAGKSTLLLHLIGYLTPQTGSVRIGDMPLTRKTLKYVRQTVGAVFQDPDDQLFMPRVYDDVAFGPTNLGLPPDEVEQRVMSALALVGADSSERPAPLQTVRRREEGRFNRDRSCHVPEHPCHGRTDFQPRPESQAAIDTPALGVRAHEDNCHARHGYGPRPLFQGDSSKERRGGSRRGRARYSRRPGFAGCKRTGKTSLSSRLPNLREGVGEGGRGVRG